MRSSEASTKDASGSAQQPEERKRNSVYDFLYHDARRIGSFLAQFEAYGALQIVKASESFGRSTATKTGASAGGGIPSVAHGQAAIDCTTTLDEREVAERTYDPLWTNAQTLLDYLEPADLIHRDLVDARIGQFVLVSGELSMHQMTLLKEVWIGPNFKEKTVDAQAAILMSKLGMEASGVTDYGWRQNG